MSNENKNSVNENKNLGIPGSELRPTSELSAAPSLKLLSVKSHVLHCYSCKRWVGRMPQWDNGELGHGWQCEHCGNTSTTMREGRPFGPHYRHWQSLVDEFADYERLDMLTGAMGKWILETVVVRPATNTVASTGTT